MKTTATNRPTNHGRQGSTGGNMGLASCGVKCLNSSSVFQINFSAGLTVLCPEIPHERQAQKRYATAKKTTKPMKILLTIILTIFSVIAFGQVDSTNQIDKELQDCLDSSENYTTKGMTNCVSTATKKWDAELNKAYKELLDLLTVEQKEKLKIAQREWIEYRDKEIEFSNQLYYDMQGTMWIPVAAQTKLDLTRKRTIELESYAANLTIDK